MSTKTSEANPRPIEKLVRTPAAQREHDKREQEERDEDTERWSVLPCTD